MKTSKYKSYSSSKADWLLEKPEHWEMIRLRHLVEIKKNIANELGYPVLSITKDGIKVKNIESNEGQLSSDYSKYQKVDVDDFAMNHMDLLTGYVDLSKDLGVTSPDYRVFSIKKDSKLEKRFLLKVLQNAYLQKIFYGYGQGSSKLGRWRLTKTNFLDFLVPCPPKEEQLLIANFIDKESIKIKDLIAKQEHLLEVFKKKITALALYAYNSNNPKYLRIGNIVEVISRPVQINPKDKYRSLGLFNKGRGLFHKPIRKGTDMGASNFFYVKPGDLILSGQFAWEGAVAIAGEEEEGCVVSHRFPILKGNENYCITEFLQAFFWSTHGNFLLNQNSRGSAGRNRPLNLDLLLKEKIAIPSIEIQTQIKLLTKQLKTLSEKCQVQKSLFLERKSALIASGITGQIDIRNMNTRDITS